MCVRARLRKRLALFFEQEVNLMDDGLTRKLMEDMERKEILTIIEHNKILLNNTSKLNKTIIALRELIVNDSIDSYKLNIIASIDVTIEQVRKELENINGTELKCIKI